MYLAQRLRHQLVHPLPQQLSLPVAQELLRLVVDQHDPVRAVLAHQRVRHRLQQRPESLPRIGRPARPPLVRLLGSDVPGTARILIAGPGLAVGFTPVVGGADALRYGRLSHVDQTCLRMETYRQANSALIDAQASIPLAQVWGGGLVASVDGMRFVVPVPSVYARPNPKHFGASTGGGGRRAGAT